LDQDVLADIKLALEESDRVDASRILLEDAGEAIILRGAVASSEEATVAALIAETRANDVSNELTIDPGLREGVEEPLSAEPVQPLEGEVLDGKADMLAGSDVEIETDIDRAVEENIPWDPPDAPHLAPTADEYQGVRSPGALVGDEEVGDPDPDLAHREDYAAADLSREELTTRGAAPSLDPQGIQPSSLAQPDPRGVEEGGHAPPEELEAFPDRVPGADRGVGATGEGTARGGGISGVPASDDESVREESPDGGL
jgi:hypothetical protein